MLQAYIDKKGAGRKEKLGRGKNIYLGGGKESTQKGATAGVCWERGPLEGAPKDRAMGEGGSIGRIPEAPLFRKERKG